VSVHLFVKRATVGVLDRASETGRRHGICDGSAHAMKRYIEPVVRGELLLHGLGPPASAASLRCRW